MDGAAGIEAVRECAEMPRIACIATGRPIIF
jgi:hypothetical protein